ncbi:hypothetical protein AB4Y63_09505 [Leifsonia sp. YAF41]|uniref:hypothetical protein n=1 Tax=Leifsonia sp. YAF41 TaxID=3233086 RepID=UPI003F95BCFA
MKRLLIVAPLIAFAFAGCAVAASAPPTVTPTPTPAVATSAVAQWAYVVAEQSATLADWKTKWDEGNCVVTQSDLTCGMQQSAGTYVTQTVSTSLKIPTAPKATAYLGETPDEIASLYAQTQSLADAAAAAGTAWSDACNGNPDAEGCWKLTFDFDAAVQQLSTKFAAWDPYL